MSRCVLVAESDPTELELIATVLARDGFRVLQVLERDQALTLFDSEEVPLVIAASDVSGRGGGAALCAEVKKRRPETRFIILHPSGNDPDARTVLLSRTGCDAVLPSPFRYDALKRLLGEWGFTAPAKVAAPVMSFAVPVPDVVDLVAPPSFEALVPEPLSAKAEPEIGSPVPIPIPLAMPVTQAIHEEPIAERPIADDPIAERPIADEPIAERPIADEPIAERPIADEPIAERPIADDPLAALPEVPPVPPQSAPQGDWLLVPPSADSARDGFAGLDFGSNIDSALDNALGEKPTARFEALPDDAARSVAMAVQAYVAESLDFGDDSPPEPAAAPEPVVVPEPADLSLPPAFDPPAPDEPDPDDTTAVEPAASVHETETVEITPATWEVNEPAAAHGESIRPAIVEAYRDSTPSGWEGDEPQSLAPPLSTIADEVIAEQSLAPPVPVDEPSPPPPEAVAPPPPPVEASSPVAQRQATGASSWSPASTPAPPEVPAEPPPPPREALDEPPALPFEAIVQRNPVGAEPRTTLPPSVPPEGDLATTPLPRLLFELYGGTYCGTLRLSRKGADRIIDVWNGFPVAVTVTPEEENDDIATILRDHGRITPEQHADAQRRAGSRAAQLLVALGVIDERDLLDCIREQTELRLAASFSWRDGTYKITPSRAPPDSVVLSEIHPVKIIWRGVCEHYDVGSLLAFFSPLRARFIVATEVFPIHYESLGPFLRSVGVAHLLNGKTTFEQALRSDDSHALTIAHTLYVLIVTEMIRAQSKPGEAAKFPETQNQAKQSKPVDYRELTRACEEVARTYLALKGRDYFAMLELERQATEKDVLAAYDRLAKPFKVENLLPGLPDDVQRRAREIDNLLRRARDTLSSPEERRRYVNRLEENQPPPPPADALAS